MFKYGVVAQRGSGWLRRLYAREERLCPIVKMNGAAASLLGSPSSDGQQSDSEEVAKLRRIIRDLRAGVDVPEEVGDVGDGGGEEKE